MTRLLEILISLAIVAALFLIVGVALPSHRHLSESVETNRKLTIVYDTLNSLRRFEDWNPLVLRDPAIQAELSGPAEGVGARLDYQSEIGSLGEGSWELVANQPNESVTYAIQNPERGKEKTTTFTLEPTGTNNRNVKITQTYDVDYGWNLLGRYAGLYVSSNVGEDMKLGLQRLSNMLAAVPNHDYAELSRDNPALAPTVAQREGETLLVVTAAVDRTNEAVLNQMKSNMQWIKRVMEDNNLESAGPVRIITNEFGSEIYSFDVAQPVRRKAGGGDETDQDEADESEDEATAEAPAEGATDEAATADAVPADMIKGIEVNGDKNPVEVVYSEPSVVAMVPFRGHMANLSKVRDALRGWALTRGYETTDRPYEEWINGFEKGFTVDGEFNVYWAVKAPGLENPPAARAVSEERWTKIRAAVEAEKARTSEQAEAGEDAGE